MSQKGEKYARRMERRVDKLEQDVAAITTEQTTQGVRISAVEDDLAVYRAAVSARELKQAAAEIKAAKERRTARAAERERKARRRNKVLAFIALALFVAVCVVMVAKAYSEEPAAEPAAQRRDNAVGAAVVAALGGPGGNPAHGITVHRGGGGGIHGGPAGNGKDRGGAAGAGLFLPGGSNAIRMAGLHEDVLRGIRLPLSSGPGGGTDGKQFRHGRRGRLW